MKAEQGLPGFPSEGLWCATPCKTKGYARKIYFCKKEPDDMQATKFLAVARTHEHAAHAEPAQLRKRIGSTVYEVRVHFNSDAKETMDDKILRLVRNDLNKPPVDVKIAVPQTGRLPERSSQ
jgi:hypothetical protein